MTRGHPYINTHSQRHDDMIDAISHAANIPRNILMGTQAGVVVDSHRERVVHLVGDVHPGQLVYSSGHGYTTNDREGLPIGHAMDHMNGMGDVRINLDFVPTTIWEEAPLSLREWWEQMINSWKKACQSPCMKCKYCLFKVDETKYCFKTEERKEVFFNYTNCVCFEEHPEILTEAMDRLIQQLVKRP